MRYISTFYVVGIFPVLALVVLLDCELKEVLRPDHELVEGFVKHNQRRIELKRHDSILKNFINPNHWREHFDLALNSSWFCFVNTDLKVDFCFFIMNCRFHFNLTNYWFVKYYVRTNDNIVEVVFVSNSF